MSFEWSLPSVNSNSDRSNTKGKLKYIGRVDISFLKQDPSTTCATVIVLDADILEVVHEEFNIVRLQVPYIPGFLAFREVLDKGFLHKLGSTIVNNCFHSNTSMLDELMSLMKREKIALHPVLISAP